MRERKAGSGEATSRETVLAAECRVTYVQGPNDFAPKCARCENKEGKRRKGWLNREEAREKEKRVTLGIKREFE